MHTNRSSLLLAVLATLAAGTAAHGDHAQEPVAGPHKGLWYNVLPGDGGTQVCEEAVVAPKVKRALCGAAEAGHCRLTTWMAGIV